MEQFRQPGVDVSQVVVKHRAPLVFLHGARLDVPLS
jgi:hypothetical protein